MVTVKDWPQHLVYRTGPTDWACAFCAEGAVNEAELPAVCDYIKDCDEAGCENLAYFRFAFESENILEGYYTLHTCFEHLVRQPGPNVDCDAGSHRAPASNCEGWWIVENGERVAAVCDLHLNQASTVDLGPGLGH